MYLLKCLVAASQAHMLGQFGEVLDYRDLEVERGSIEGTFYALANMIENGDVNNGNASQDLNDKDREALRQLSLYNTYSLQNCLLWVLPFMLYLM